MEWQKKLNIGKTFHEKREEENTNVSIKVYSNQKQGQNAFDKKENFKSKFHKKRTKKWLFKRKNRKKLI